MDPKTVSLLGAIIVSVVALLTFTGALVVAFFLFYHNTDEKMIQFAGGLLNLTVGAAIANATTAVGFWLGSSSGSQKKDDVISQQLAASNAAAAPVVTKINPQNGSASGGTAVTLTGAGFTSATAVRFGASSVVPTSVSDTQITATSPAGQGAVHVTVVTPAGTSTASSADQFTYQP